MTVINATLQELLIYENLQNLQLNRQIFIENTGNSEKRQVMKRVIDTKNIPHNTIDFRDFNIRYIYILKVISHDGINIHKLCNSDEGFCFSSLFCTNCHWGATFESVRKCLSSIIDSSTNCEMYEFETLLELAKWLVEQETREA